MLLIRNVLIHNGKQSDPSRYDMLIVDGTIAQIGSHIQNDQAQTIHANGLWAVPGIVDAHVHLRQPGYDYKETVEMASKAAVSGGVTAFCAMPNLIPCPDDPETLQHVRTFQKDAPISIIQSCAVNCSLTGERSDWVRLREMGASFFTNDGYPIDSMSDLAAILTFSRDHGVVVADHPENRGMDERIDQTESVVILRDLFLNEKVRGRLHLQHVSLSKSLEWMDLAKQRHIPFTAETCPHYFIPVEPALHSGAYEVYPPLRDEQDRQAILQAIISGRMDIIASDHAPHTIEEKMAETPARGFSGVELLFPLCFDALVRSKKLALDTLLDLLHRNPSRLLGMEPLGFQEGERADFFLFDPKEKWMVEPSVMHSKGKNTPFIGKRLTGRVKATIISGKMVFPFEGAL